jgi:peptidoglycan/LPS O-acetylase OafA/YrhL
MRRDNSFDLIRLGLAWIVVGAHCHDLSLSPALQPYGPLLQSGRAVDAFFAISGCLIVASWDRTRSTREYFVRRARRILPAYWLALFFCLVLGAVMTTLPETGYWHSVETWKYLGANILFLNFLHPGLPGVFQANPLEPAMDGALWTIKLEVMFYLIVPVLVWFVRRWKPLPVLGSVFVLSVGYHEFLAHRGHHNLAIQLPGQLCFFMVGALVYYNYNWFEANRGKVWLVSLPLLALAVATNWFVLDALAIPLFTLAVAFLLPTYRGITAHGDFSYGTYVLHFPIVQAVIALGLFAYSPWLAVGVVVVCVAAAAVFSWFAVERQFLRPARVKQQESEVVAEAV